MMLSFLDRNSGAFASMLAMVRLPSQPTVMQVGLGICYLMLSASLSGSLCWTSQNSTRIPTQTCCRWGDQKIYPLYPNNQIQQSGNEPSCSMGLSRMCSVATALAFYLYYWRGMREFLDERRIQRIERWGDQHDFSLERSGHAEPAIEHVRLSCSLNQAATSKWAARKTASSRHRTWRYNHLYCGPPSGVVQPQ